MDQQDTNKEGVGADVLMIIIQTIVDKRLVSEHLVCLLPGRSLKTSCYDIFVLIFQNSLQKETWSIPDLQLAFWLDYQSTSRTRPARAS